jgi:hypothetical protein
MKNNTNIRNLILDIVLSTSEMRLIKGGASNSGNTNNSNNGSGNITNATDDDKRRERPGGGIATH